MAMPRWICAAVPMPNSGMLPIMQARPACSPSVKMRAAFWMPPDSVRAVIRAYTGKGVNFLKYGASGHVDMNFISFSERVQRVIVEEGHRAGMTVQTHTTSVESLDMAIEAGVDIVLYCCSAYRAKASRGDDHGAEQSRWRCPWPDIPRLDARL